MRMSHGTQDAVFWLAWLLSELATFSMAILLVVCMGSYTGGMSHVTRVNES